MEQYSFDWYERDNLIAYVVYAGTWPHAQLVSYETFTGDMMDWPFFVGTSEALNQCFKERAFHCKGFYETSCRAFGISGYHAEVMCRLGHGVMAHDTFWMKFENEDPNLSWIDVSLDRVHLSKQGGKI